MLVALCGSARAEGPVIGGHSARSIGRAGVGTISDDGGGALFVNPAAITRRQSTRLQLGLLFTDDEVYWLESDTAPAARDQSSSRLLPSIACELALGDWVVGATVAESAHSERQLRRPGRLVPADFGNAFEYRYTGLAGGFRRDTISVGAARLLGTSVAVGAAVAGSRVEVSETRRLWAGLAGRDSIGDPTYDVELTLDGVASFEPSAVAGVLVAPEDSRIELGASIGWSAPAHTHGDVSSIPIGTERNQPPKVNASITSTDNARLEVVEPVAVHTGARYLGERWALELGGDLWIFPRRAQAASWQLSNVQLIDTTTLGSTRMVDLQTLPSRLSSRTHGALRAAIDVELIAGFLWATTGYAYTTAGTAHARRSPTFGDLGGHTFALGLEATAGSFTVSLGWARTWSIKAPEPFSAWRLDNPFGTGDASVPAGTYDGSTDMIGISVDVDL